MARGSSLGSGRAGNHSAGSPSRSASTAAQKSSGADIGERPGPGLRQRAQHHPRLHRPVPAVALQAHRHVVWLRAGGRQRALRGAKRHAAGAGAAAGQGEAGVVALLPHRRDVLDPRSRNHQHRRGVALAERADPLQLLGEVEVERSAGHHGVDRLHALEVIRRQPLARMRGERGAKRRDRLGVDLQAGRHAVAAEPGQVLARGREAGVQVVRSDAASRAAAGSAVEADHHAWAPVALHEPRGDDADHARDATPPPPPRSPPHSSGRRTPPRRRGGCAARSRAGRG